MAQTRPANQSPSNAALGRDKADDERCVECHGQDGQGAGHANSTEGKFPKLAGQSANYMAKQIRDFRSGLRKHDQMEIVARNVSDNDASDILAYFAALPRGRAQDGATSEAGRALYQAGDAARGIVACRTCHGEQGRGAADNALIPALGGQEWRYLDKQLRDWRAGERHNSPGAAMNVYSRSLSDGEIEALASYLASL